MGIIGSYNHQELVKVELYEKVEQDILKNNEYMGWSRSTSTGIQLSVYQIENVQLTHFYSKSVLVQLVKACVYV